MEIKGDGNKSDPDENGGSEFNDGELPPPASMTFKGTLLLENTGEAAVTHDSHGLSWKLLDPFPEVESCCAELKVLPKGENGIKFDEVYGVAFIGHGLIRSSSSKKQIFNRESNDSEMYRFTVHGSMKSHAEPCLLVPASYTFGHNDMQVCQAWVDRISASLSKELGRPKKLLVLVNPLSGKTNGCRIWEIVAPIFLRAKVETQVIVTERAGHAFDVMASTANKDLITYDGVIVVGGDGFFNEVLNGFLLSRHKAPYPPSPSNFLHSGQSNDNVNSPTETMAETANHNEVSAPLLSDSTINGPAQANFRSEGGSSCETDEDLEFPLPSERFRFGIIPAGSTDGIVMCTTGTRDPITSALQIVLGKRVSLDVAQVVRWKTTSASAIEPCIRYATSFAGYGFYGDVIQESEKYRWMGPKRYDYAGTKVFLKHSLKTEASVLPLCMKLETAVKEWPWNDCNTSCFGSYEAEVAYLETESDKTNSTAGNGHLLSRVKLMLGHAKSERVICRRNCRICNTNTVYGSKRSAGGTPYSRPEESKWGRSKGRFLSVGAAIISNRNEKAPDGLVADAHLSDGFLHLLLIRECPRASYLWHLTQLTKKGGRPLNFGFVEHHKTRAFTFTSIGKESIWNLDGELFPAHRLSAQVFRGLISLFASGPEA